MTKILPVASGKGGVGKTVLVANLGCYLASRGKTVILIDLDLGGANLHTCLGLKNRYPGLGNYIYKQESSLESLLVKTEIDRLFFIPGDHLLPGTANLNFFVKQKIIKNIKKLIADYIILDLGSGSAFNTIDFFLTSSTGIIVITPETTSILNAYGFLKTVIFRLLSRSFPYKSSERQVIKEFSTNRIEGTDVSIVNLLDNLSAISKESKDKAVKQLKFFFPRIILNMGETERDLMVGTKLRTIVRKNLGVEIEYIGFIRKDETTSRSIIERKPVLFLYPNSEFSKSAGLAAEKLIDLPAFPNPELYEDNEDLNNLNTALHAQYY